VELFGGCRLLVRMGGFAALKSGGQLRRQASLPKVKRGPAKRRLRFPTKRKRCQRCEIFFIKPCLFINVSPNFLLGFLRTALAQALLSQVATT
jgi:hypothetical protein